MLIQRFKTLLRRLRKDMHGAVVVESMIALPLLFWVTMASFEFYEVHRYKAVREKATYTVADMISREGCQITRNYLDKTFVLYNDMLRDRGANQIRFTVVEYDGSNDKYEVKWSFLRGDGDLESLPSGELANGDEILPALSSGQQIILVETFSTYKPYFRVGMGNSIDMETRIFISPRFVPKVDYKSALEAGDCEDAV
ncbi:TadE/TadG family type IV pilus assembly protein [Roseovarius sp. MMSF_3281]|uniref:TadE/TadG family type IV pilus assembly protein n=1 Tax=Roseovarius sp. MMSF_3281 TaxID=3046694 RepID=UPI00273F4833|nr:pilus assembly protein [Roseovarius sp. MMSF_3281]